MKNIFGTAAFICLSVSLFAQGSIKNVVKVYPLIKESVLAYERAILPKSSAELQVGGVKGINLNQYADQGLLSLKNYPANGYVIKAGYKMYVSKRVLTGFYHGPQLTYKNMRIDIPKPANDTTPQKVTVPTTLRAGILSYTIGGQVKLLKIIAFSGYTGMGYKIQYSPTMYRGEPVLQDMIPSPLNYSQGDKYYKSLVFHFGIGFGIIF